MTTEMANRYLRDALTQCYKLQAEGKRSEAIELARTQILDIEAALPTIKEACRRVDAARPGGVGRLFNPNRAAEIDRVSRLTHTALDQLEGWLRQFYAIVDAG